MQAVRRQSSTGVWRIRIDETDDAADPHVMGEILAGGAREVRIEGPDPWRSPSLLRVAEALTAGGRFVSLHTPEVAVVSGERCASLRAAGVQALEVPAAAAMARPRAFVAALAAACAAGLEPRLVLAGTRASGLDVERLRKMMEAVVRVPGGPGITVLVDGFEAGADRVTKDVALAVRVGRGRHVRVQLRDVHDVTDPRLCVFFEREIALDAGRAEGFLAQDLVHPDVVETVIRVAGTPTGMAHLLAARGRPVRDLPPCVGGRGELPEGAIRAPACASCPLVDCRGMEPRHHASFPLGPRPSWSGVGRRIALVVEEHALFGAYGAGGVARGMREAGCDVSVARMGDALPSVDTVVATPFAAAAALLEVDPDRHVVVLDYHMLGGIDALSRAFVPPGRRAEEGGWWPSRLFVVSSFPSFAHLYSTAGVPLERVAWFPYCVDRTALPAPSNDPGAPILCAGAHLRDWRTLERAAERLDGTPIEVVFPPNQPVQRVGSLRPTGRCELNEFLPRLARARFAVVVCHADAQICAGGSTIVCALALGKPVVATWTPMARDLLRHGVDSLVVPAGDDRALAEAIDAVDRDDALRARLAAGAAASGRARDAAVLGRWLALGFPPRAVWPAATSDAAGWHVWPSNET